MDKETSSPKRRIKKRFVIPVVVLLLLVVAAPFIVIGVSKFFTAQEGVVRSDWSIDAGAVLGRNEELNIDFAEADLNSDQLRVIRLVPGDISDDGFTFYDTAVQDRLDQAIESLKTSGMAWTATNPLAVLNPYGTGANGLYLYFETDVAAHIDYTIHVADEAIPDFSATAAEADGQPNTRAHEIQIIGLVPGEENTVTLDIVGSWGNLRQTVTFTIEMPETESGYDTTLEVTDGPAADEAQAEGLFTMMRVNGYLGYGFMFDDAGVLRYEMVLEGFGLDRMLFDGNDIITCVSATKLARINGLGQVEQVYDLGDYALHHDIGFGRDGEILALAELTGGETVEDQMLSINIETGEVTHLLDFTALLPDYFAITRPIQPTDPMFWQVSEWDWIHLNSLQYLPEEDSVIVSSRETSTIMKFKNIHSAPTLDWLAGDDNFWADTPYASYCLAQDGDFVPQYGQHCVEYLAAGDADGVYYLALYNNNYWALSSRDGYEADVADTVGTDLYGLGHEKSQVYVYKIDENARTFSLEQSFDVPYSSIVSNGSQIGDSGHWAVNSGISMVFGEYTADGTLIREYAYECTMQNYRTFKYEYTGFWFA